MTRCQCITAQKTKCKREAMPNSKYCKQHSQKQKDIGRCNKPRVVRSRRGKKYDKLYGIIFEFDSLENIGEKFNVLYDLYSQPLTSSLKSQARNTFEMDSKNSEVVVSDIFKNFYISKVKFPSLNLRNMKNRKLIGSINALDVLRGNKTLSQHNIDIREFLSLKPRKIDMTELEF